jgi:hypothetical protein
MWLLSYARAPDVQETSMAFLVGFGVLVLFLATFVVASGTAG